MRSQSEPWKRLDVPHAGNNADGLERHGHENRLLIGAANRSRPDESRPFGVLFPNRWIDVG